MQILFLYFVQKDVNSYSKSKAADKQILKLRDFIETCWKNLHHTQKLQKYANNKSVRAKSYASNDKIRLNSKYIKTKQNPKLEAKFFAPFWVLYQVKKQA